MTFIYGKAKYGKMLEHMISWRVLVFFTPKSANDNLGLTLSFYMEKIHGFCRSSRGGGDHTS